MEQNEWDLENGKILRQMFFDNRDKPLKYIKVTMVGQRLAFEGVHYKKRKMKNIFQEILEERKKQDEIWGIQNHPIIDYNYKSPIHYRYELPSEERVKNVCRIMTEENELTWGDIVLEELVEALCAKNKEDMRAELIQCSAVILAMIESLDRNGR